MVVCGQGWGRGRDGDWLLTDLADEAGDDAYHENGDGHSDETSFGGGEIQPGAQGIGAGRRLVSGYGGWIA